MILQALRDAGSVDGSRGFALSAEQVDALYPDSQQLYECLDALGSEGLIQIDADGTVRFAD